MASERQWRAAPATFYDPTWIGECCRKLKQWASIVLLRLTQDEIQKACSLGKGKKVDDKTREKVMALAAASIKYPEGGIKLGDWKKGRELAWSGYGFRTAHNPDDHVKGTPGGNCYNCHQLATDRTGGNIGPALTGYGARGTSPDMLKYTYDVIYNPHVYFACTNMPRMGAVGVLNQQQIAEGVGVA